MIKVILNKHSGFTGTRYVKLLRCVDLLEKTVNSPAFEERVKNFSYYKWVTIRYGFLGLKKRQVLERGDNFRWNDGLTKEEIFNDLMEGDEVLLPEKDFEIDLDMSYIVRSYNGVLGYTYPNIIGTYIYSWFFDSAEDWEIVGNMMHEYWHKKGFDHEFNFTALREFTVPYAIGYIAEKVAKEIKKGVV